MSELTHEEIMTGLEEAHEGRSPGRFLWDLRDMLEWHPISKLPNDVEGLVELTDGDDRSIAFVTVEGFFVFDGGHYLYFDDMLKKYTHWRVALPGPEGS